MNRPGGKYWHVTLRYAGRENSIVETDSRGGNPGIAVKRVLDAACPSLRVGEIVIVKLERLENKEA